MQFCVFEKKLQLPLHNKEGSFLKLRLNKPLCLLYTNLDKHLLKGKKRQTAFIAIFAFIPFITLLVNILAFGWSPFFLLTLITLPMSICLVSSTWKFINGLPRNDTPKWWMGPMGDWDSYVKAGLDWFLFRWLLARNIDSFYCLVVIAVAIAVLCF